MFLEGRPSFIVEYNSFIYIHFHVSVSGCGHCKRLAPVYEKVAGTFKNDANVGFLRFSLPRSLLHKFLIICQLT